MNKERKEILLKCISAYREHNFQRYIVNDEAIQYKDVDSMLNWIADYINENK